ncbi:plasma membrane ascorbate-dependent reductase CYBRD1 [Microcaecilia unicolor]|uniref:Plasma membrane ascorbate-dependent reductase CYBRD1 n=1 Tax=Microcaecilia unicolor TaxID=1415580 RepID=A0A6P7YSL8_9AMPH|nr:cytochrome b reductase 1 [Microcaecilia unicolor]
MGGYGCFIFCLLASLLAGFFSILFVLVWVLYWREGLSWDGALAEFNWHPLLIVIGFIVLQGFAIVVYRLPWTWRCSKFLMKCIHAGLHLTVLILATVSLVAVFDFHNNKNIPNMYSMHSWLGLAAVVLYGVQILIGLLVYLFPFAPVTLRATLLPFHVFSGLLIFGAGIATALMGITEKLFFALKSPHYSTSPPEALFVNFLGAFILIFGAFVFWMVTQPQWKRPQEEVPKTLGAEEEGKISADCENSKMESNKEATRKRYVYLDEAGERSTM